MEIIYLITAKQRNKLETLPMPFSIMSRMFVGCVLNIACKAANGRASMYATTKKKKKEERKKQQPGHGGGRKQYGQ